MVHKLRGFALWAVLSGIVVAGMTGCAAPATHELPQSAVLDLSKIRLMPQLTGEWCWAASGEMIMAYFGENVSQCRQATDRFKVDTPQINCCGNPPNVDCVRGGWPKFEDYKFKEPRVRAGCGLSWDELRQEIAMFHRPFTFTLRYTDAEGRFDPNSCTGHMMVVYGYRTDRAANGSENRRVLILNPWPQPGPGVLGGTMEEIGYNEYLANLEPGHAAPQLRLGGPNELPQYCVHWDDQYNIRR